MTHSSTYVDQRMLQLLSNKNAEYHATLNVEMGYEMNTVEHFVVQQMLIVSYWL